MGSPYVTVPGTSGRYFATPNRAESNIVGDIDERFKLAAVDWTPAAVQQIATNIVFGVSGVGVRLNTDGKFRVYAVSSGAGGSQARDVNPGALVNGQAYEIRITWDVSATVDAMSIYVDGVLVGNTTAGTALGNHVPATQDLSVGANASGLEMFAGDIYWYERRDGIDGDVVARFDAADVLEAVLA